MASDCEVRTLSSIGSEIKSWCKQNKVNQTELAAALDVSTMTVRRVWKYEDMVVNVIKENGYVAG